MPSTLTKGQLPPALRRWGLVRFLDAQKQLLSAAPLTSVQRVEVLGAVQSARMELGSLPSDNPPKPGRP
jgi:hypothetical protein